MEAVTASAFPLRFRNERLRELVREVAEREHISQNELLEQAARHEVIARGALLADDLAASAARLASVTARAYDQLVAASLEAFADGEANPEPLRPWLISRHSVEADVATGLVAVAAFHRAR